MKGDKQQRMESLYGKESDFESGEEKAEEEVEKRR